MLVSNYLWHSRCHLLARLSGLLLVVTRVAKPTGGLALACIAEVAHPDSELIRRVSEGTPVSKLAHKSLHDRLAGASESSTHR